MAKDNFFPLGRGIQKHWLWKDKPFSKGQAWVDMLLLANYKDKKEPYKGEIIICKRGDVNMSITELAKRWGWSRRKTRDFLRLLESDGMVVTNATTHRTTITIENYEKYQSDGTTNSTTSGQQADSKRTTSGQQADTTKKEKKEKKDKKDKKDIYKGVPPELEDAFMEFVEMRKQIKKPITTEKAVTRALNKLNELSDTTEGRIEIINQSVDKCWTSFYEIKKGGKKSVDFMDL